MSNVMSLKSLKNNVKRNGFDLSFKNAFSAKAGELLPIFCKEVIPGDKFKIKGQAFTRTQPVASAAFVRLREYYDFFFVPYKLLWNRFPTFFTNLPDFHQSSSINAAATTTEQHPYFTRNDILNYLYSSNVTGDGSKPYVNFFGFNRSQLSIKLLDYLGYGAFENDNPSPTPNADVVLNPTPLLAYQKVCQDFFRDDQWEQAAPWRYNLDYIVNDSVHIPVSSIDASQYNMFDLNYCNWPKDYFMGMLPSPQYGEEAFVPVNYIGGNKSIFIDEPYVHLDEDASGSGRGTLYTEESSSVTRRIQASANNTNFYNVEGISGSLPAGLFGDTFNLSVLALRQAESMQKWKEISQSGRQDYKTQMEKHFGVSPSDAMSNHCKYIGGWTSNLDINEVVNTNLTDRGSSQADIQGKGVGSSDGFMDFEAKEHGILIGLYHCLPLLDYAINSVDKLNLKSNFTDYAIPEFDSIGMQQVQLYELWNALEVPPSNSLQLGWVPRYADYKTSVDKVHGIFNDTLKYWVAPIDAAYVGAHLEKFSLDYTFFKVDPSILNNIFAVEVDDTVNTDEFLVNCFFDVKAVRNLDYNGLPY